jgi:hypothetical protein
MYKQKCDCKQKLKRLFGFVIYLLQCKDKIEQNDYSNDYSKVLKNKTRFGYF